MRYGVVATNAHVIEEEFISNLEVRFPSAPAGSQGPTKAQLLYEDRKRDIAFLAVKSDLPVLPLAPNYSFVKGEDVIVIGNPGMGDETVLENAISRGVMSSKTVIEGMPYHQMNIAINPGNSGGPVFDSLGRVIGVATLKSNKTEAMGFSIPVEDVNAALAKVGGPRPELGSHHRAVVALRLLTIGGALYSIALEVRAGVLQAAPKGADPNLLPTEEVQKLHEAVTSLDEKLFSLVDGELPTLRSDPNAEPDSTAWLSRACGQLPDHEEALRKPEPLCRPVFLADPERKGPASPPDPIVPERIECSGIQPAPGGAAAADGGRPTADNGRRFRPAPTATAILPRSCTGLDWPSRINRAPGTKRAAGWLPRPSSGRARTPEANAGPHEKANARYAQPCPRAVRQSVIDRPSIVTCDQARHRTAGCSSSATTIEWTAS